MRLKTKKAITIIVLVIYVLLFVVVVYLWFRLFKSSPDNVIGRMITAIAGTLVYFILIGASSFPMSRLTESIADKEKENEDEKSQTNS